MDIFDAHVVAFMAGVHKLLHIHPSGQPGPLSASGND
jgi:hypothetical protein